LRASSSTSSIVAISKTLPPRNTNVDGNSALSEGVDKIPHQIVTAGAIGKPLVDDSRNLVDPDIIIDPQIEPCVLGPKVHRGIRAPDAAGDDLPDQDSDSPVDPEIRINSALRLVQDRARQSNGMRRHG